MRTRKEDSIRISKMRSEFWKKNKLTELVGKPNDKMWSRPNYTPTHSHRTRLPLGAVMLGILCGAADADLFARVALIKSRGLRRSDACWRHFIRWRKKFRHTSFRVCSTEFAILICSWVQWFIEWKCSVWVMFPVGTESVSFPRATLLWIGQEHGGGGV
jgi:hypothetical protein